MTSKANMATSLLVQMNRNVDSFHMNTTYMDRFHDSDLTPDFSFFFLLLVTGYVRQTKFASSLVSFLGYIMHFYFFFSFHLMCTAEIRLHFWSCSIFNTVHKKTEVDNCKKRSRLRGCGSAGQDGERDLP